MKFRKSFATVGASAGLLFLLASPVSLAADHSMGFFVTSVGVGDGVNLGGVAGGDAHCAKLAGMAGSKGRTWRAYLST